MTTNKSKIKRNHKYYAVIEGDSMYNPTAIVSVRVIKNVSGIRSNLSRWWIVEQSRVGFTHRLIVHEDDLAPNIMNRAMDLVHNKDAWHNRRAANNWRFNLRRESAKREVLKALAELSSKDQNEIWSQLSAAYPALMKTATSVKSSKMMMKHWDLLAWVIIAAKYPLKDVWTGL